MNPTNPYPRPNPSLLYAPEQPTPQDYADALDQLGKQAQTGIRTPSALGSNLLADAILQYGQARARKAQQPTGTIGVASPGPNPLLSPPNPNLWSAAHGPTGGNS